MSQCFLIIKKLFLYFLIFNNYNEFIFDKRFIKPFLAKNKDPNLQFKKKLCHMWYSVSQLFNYSEVVIFLFFPPSPAIEIVY